MIDTLKVLLRTTRPSFLILTPICVFLGVALTGQLPRGEDRLIALLVLIGAVCAHVSVNTLNEYFDYKSGLDLKTDRTPFSGGSGALPVNPVVARATLVLGVATLLVTCVVGVYLVWLRGVLVLPIGLVGVLLVALYTQWINRFPLLCLIAPGGGFGLLMVMGTYVVLTGTYSLDAFLIALIPFLLLNNLLLLNQYPDIKADKSIGRRTFPIVYGVGAANLVYALFTVSAYSLLLCYIYLGVVPVLGAIALLPMGFSLYALYGGLSFGEGIGKHSRYLAANVVASLFTPLLLGVAIIS